MFDMVGSFEVEGGNGRLRDGCTDPLDTQDHTPLDSKDPHINRALKPLESSGSLAA
jgi:hypothetical protein